MASAPKPEFAPLLPYGFHDYRLDDLRGLCVNGFPGSITRAAIMDGFESVLGEINATGIKVDVWVNGSFLTQKFNPEDVDFAVRCEEAVWRAADIRQKSILRCVNETDLKPQYKCDAYAFTEYAPNPGSGHGQWEWDRAYWLKQFGFSRKEERKGLAVLKLPFIIT